MYGYKYWISFLLALAIDAVSGNCLFPGEVEDATAVAKTLKTSYDTDDLLLYECNAKGASHVARYCQSDRTWTAPDRQCSDSHIWNYGSLAGVLVASLNFFVAIFAVVYSQVKFKGKKSHKDNAKDTRIQGDAMTSETKVSEGTDEDNNRTKPESNHEIKSDPQSSAKNSNINVRFQDDSRSQSRGEPSAVHV